MRVEDPHNKFLEGKLRPFELGDITNSRHHQPVQRSHWQVIKSHSCVFRERVQLWVLIFSCRGKNRHTLLVLNPAMTPLNHSAVCCCRLDLHMPISGLFKATAANSWLQFFHFARRHPHTNISVSSQCQWLFRIHWEVDCFAGCGATACCLDSICRGLARRFSPGCSS